MSAIKKTTEKQKNIKTELPIKIIFNRTYAKFLKHWSFENYSKLLIFNKIFYPYKTKCLLKTKYCFKKTS